MKSILLDDMEEVNICYPYADRDIMLGDILNYEDNSGNIIECFVKFITDKDNIMVKYIRINEELTNINKKYNPILPK